MDIGQDVMFNPCFSGAALVAAKALVHDNNARFGKRL
jgi:uncharacterized membrane-anchored protein